MTKNNKGFVITEVLILSTVIIGVLVFMYSQFKNINRGYQYSFKYDTPEGMYLANNIVNYINDGNYDKLVELLNTKPEGYVDITECNIDNSNLITYCNALFQKSDIEKIIFTEENLTKIKQNMNNLENDLKNYINQIKTTNEKNDYRIIIKYKNNTFATMRFNKGNAYVEEGLIAHLDGINNTGNGHSTEVTTWKDLSNNGNDATLYNNPTWSNNSLTFDGIDDYGILTNTANQAFPNGLTLETRVKILTTDNGDSLSYVMYVDNETSSSPYDGLSQYVNKANLKTTSRVAPNGTYAFAQSDESIIEVNKIYTITTTYDNNTVKEYIDGKLVASSDKTGQYPGSPQGINIGRRYSGNYTVNVEFQNVLIYDRALTENEVLRNYQADLARY